MKITILGPYFQTHPKLVDGHTKPWLVVESLSMKMMDGDRGYTTQMYSQCICEDWSSGFGWSFFTFFDEFPGAIWSGCRSYGGIHIQSGESGELWSGPKRMHQICHPVIKHGNWTNMEVYRTGKSSRIVFWIIAMLPMFDCHVRVSKDDGNNEIGRANMAIVSHIQHTHSMVPVILWFHPLDPLHPLHPLHLPWFLGAVWYGKVIGLLFPREYLLTVSFGDWSPCLFSTSVYGKDT